MEHHFQPRLGFRQRNKYLTTTLSFGPYPRYQHRPSFITPCNPVETIPTKDVKRWNFRKAKWEQFAHLVESGIDMCRLPVPLTQI